MTLRSRLTFALALLSVLITIPVAGSTVSPSGIGGLRMASELIRPHVVGLLDQMLKEQEATVRVDEIELVGMGPWAGKTLEALSLKQRYNLLVLGLKTRAGANAWELRINPADQEVVPEQGSLIVMGNLQDVRRARQDARAPESSDGLPRESDKFQDGPQNSGKQKPSTRV